MASVGAGGKDHSTTFESDFYIVTRR